MGSETRPAGGPLWLIPKLIVWVGASTGALSLICTTFGFLVEHAYLDRLGVPRTVYEATSAEYLVTGAKFLAGVVPSAVVGAALFALSYWWMLLVVALSAIVIRWRRLGTNARLGIVTAVYGFWLSIMLVRFESGHSSPDTEGLAIFTFGTVAGVLYCCFELFVAAGKASPRPATEYLARIPLFALVFCCAFGLPLLKGIHGTQRQYPIIEFSRKDGDFFCELAGQTDKKDCGKWQLIELGKERALLRRPPDPAVYVVPVSELKTFRLSQGGP
jgi:hypothetical protein